MKYLVLLLVFVVFYAYWRSQNRPAPLPRTPPPLAPPQDMVACDHCGLHLPRSEALSSGGHHYCCAEHQRSDAR